MRNGCCPFLVSYRPPFSFFAAATFANARQILRGGVRCTGSLVVNERSRGLLFEERFAFFVEHVALATEGLFCVLFAFYNPPASFLGTPLYTKGAFEVGWGGRGILLPLPRVIRVRAWNRSLCYLVPCATCVKSFPVLQLC